MCIRDSYFNCLTVGTVMRPVTDKFKIARTKLAYIIDATAAPVCILAPISSWAAAVGSSLPEGSSIDGFGLFLQTIPINLYAWLTLIFMCFLVWSEKDFSEIGASIRKNEREFYVPPEYADVKEEKIEGRGKIYDLLLPLSLIHI